MTDVSFSDEMMIRKYHPVLSGGCSLCDARGICMKVHADHYHYDSCYGYFKVMHGSLDGHWKKNAV